MVYIETENINRTPHAPSEASEISQITFKDFVNISGISKSTFKQ